MRSRSIKSTGREIPGVNLQIVPFEESFDWGLGVYYSEGEVPVLPMYKCAICEADVGLHSYNHVCEVKQPISQKRITMLPPPPSEDACCSEGDRFSRETGQHAYDHPGHCNQLNDTDRRFIVMVTEMRKHLSYDRMMQLLYQKGLVEPK